MRRTSVITIILLVLVIVGLSIALVATNLPEQGKNTQTGETEVQNVNKNEEEEKVNETPTEVSLDSEVVKDMYHMINDGNSDFFHYFKTGKITKDDLSNEEKQIIAYYYYAMNNTEELTDAEIAIGRESKIKASVMDEAIKKVFGDVSYNHTYGYVQSTKKSSNLHHLFEYDESNGVYYVYGGFGGGSDTLVYTAITQVEEYSDRYEVTEKLLVAVTTSSDMTLYPFYGRNVRFSDVIETVQDSDISSMSNSKNVYCYAQSGNSDYAEKLISTYYDDATEYKHTFMKNEDGTYYWAKSEIVK